MVDTFHFKTRVDLKDPIGRRRLRAKLLSRDHARLRQALRRGPRRRAEHRPAERRDRPGRGLGRVLLQPRQPLESPRVRQAHALLRLLQRPRHVLPDHRSRIRRRLRRRPGRLPGRGRRRRTHDGQGALQYLQASREIRAETGVSSGSRSSVLLSVGVVRSPALASVATRFRVARSKLSPGARK